MERLHQLYERLAATVDRYGRAWPFVVISILTLAVVALINPAKLGAYLWIICKLSIAFVLGYGFDKGAARNSDPDKLEPGIERSMAQSRRALLIGLTVLAAGLMP